MNADHYDFYDKKGLKKFWVKICFAKAKDKIKNNKNMKTEIYKIEDSRIP